MSLSGVLTGSSAAAPSGLLPAGYYWMDGDGAAELPIYGNAWNAWDGATDEVASGNTISFLRVIDPAAQLTGSSSTIGWKGTLTTTYRYGDASSLGAIATGGLPPSIHPGFSSEAFSKTLTALVNQPAYVGVFTQSDGSEGTILLEAGSFT